MLVGWEPLFQKLLAWRIASTISYGAGICGQEGLLMVIVDRVMLAIESLHGSRGTVTPRKLSGSWDSNVLSISHDETSVRFLSSLGPLLLESAFSDVHVRVLSLYLLMYEFHFIHNLIG